MSVLRAILGALGLAGLGYGLYGLTNTDGLNVPGVIEFLAAVLIGHDLILLPVAALVGFLIARYAPTAARRWLQAGLLVTAVITFVAIPLLVGAGRIPDNPSRLPLDYVRGYWLVIVVIWFTASAGYAGSLILAARRGRQ
jgi:hypothetical protein